MKRVVLSEDESTSTKDGSSPSTHSHVPPTGVGDQRLVSTQQQQQQNRRRELPQILPPEFMAVLVPAFKVGAGAGTCGLFTGAAFGIIRSAHPILFALFTSLQWFTLGSSFCASRLIAIKAMGGDQRQLTPADTIAASALGGGFAGVMGALLRSPRNVAPAAVVFSMFGAGGQGIANAVGTRRDSGSASQSNKKSWGAKWNPFQRLTDQDYENILQERLLHVRAEMAVIDDNIKELYEAEGRAPEPREADNTDVRKHSATRDIIQKGT